MSDLKQLSQWRTELRHANPGEVMAWAQRTFPDQVVYATSLGAESAVLFHHYAQIGADLPVFTLDTGRLFPETYDLIETIKLTYNIDIRLYFPEREDVEDAVNHGGPNFFRQSQDLRKHCCFIRKVKPLSRALKGSSAWITGLRREQSVNRESVEVIEWDAGNENYKINPLWRWTADEVWDYIRAHNLPYNPLHDQGFPSIGCAPCTRAVLPGEPERAGRWWWEEEEKKECGLHFVEGRLVRAGAGAES